MRLVRARLKLECLEERTTPDVGDTLSTALATGLVPGGAFTQASEPIGDGPLGTSDVDIYSFDAAAGNVVIIRTTRPSGGVSMDTMVRLFDASGTQLDINDDYGGGLYSALSFTLPADGTYYIGISGYNNSRYDPVTGGGTVAGDTGDYRLDVVLGDQAALIDDAGDSVFEAVDLGVYGSGYATLSQTLGDGAFGAADVDLYAVYAAGPAALFVATSPPTPGLD